MNIQQFEYVLAVATYKHFERAAEKCFVAQSTLSTMISKFEQELGLILFDRSRKPVEVTIEGQQVIERLKIITGEISSLKEAVKEIKGAIKGKVTIGCIPTIAPFLLPLFLRTFSQTYPEVHIELNERPTEEIIWLLERRELDIGIVSPPFKSNSDLVEIPLYREPFVYYDVGGTPTNQMDVKTIDFDDFWLLEESHCMSDQVLDICKAHQKNIYNSLNIRFKAGSIGSLVQFVRGNQGRTLLPYLAAQQLLKDEQDRISSFKEPAPGRTVSLLVHPHFPKKKLLNLLRIAILEKVEAIQEITTYAS